MHYTMPDSHPFAGRVVPGIVTRVYSDTAVELCVFTPEPDGVPTAVLSETPTRGYAHWPQLNADVEQVSFVPAQTFEQSGEVEKLEAQEDLEAPDPPQQPEPIDAPKVEAQEFEEGGVPV